MLTLGVLACCLSLAIGADRPGHLANFGEQGNKVPITEREGFLDPMNFHNDFVLKSKPLIMRGAFKSSPAFTKWSDEYLWNKTQPRPKGDIVVEMHKIQPLRQRVEPMHFHDFLTKYNTSDYYMIDFVPDSVKKDVVLFFPVQCQNFIKNGLSTNMMWFSSGGTRGIIHQDPYENMLCALRSHKHFVFLDLRKYDWIRPLVLDHPGHSSIDVDRIDLNRWPFLEGLDYLHGTVYPGDCIYIPFETPHQVRSYGDSNLAVSVWWYNRQKKPPKNCLKKEDTRITFDKVLWMENLNRSHVEAKNVIFTFWKTGMQNKDHAVAILAMGNEPVMQDKEFIEVVHKLYDAADINNDGKVDEKDDAKEKLLLKELKALVRGLEEYNKVIYKIRESGISGYLPKYFFQFEGGVFDSETTYGYLHYKYDQPDAPLAEDDSAKAREEDDDDVSMFDPKDEL